MIDTMEELLESLLEEARRTIKAKRSQRIVSFTKKINRINPLAFFEGAKHMYGERIFWASTSDDFYLVGLGNIAEIIAEESRYKKTERAWKRLLAEAIVHNPYKAPGTGIVLMGGMSFDPRKDRTDLWKNFAASQFKIPEIVLMKQDADYYLTTNVLVDGQMDVRQSVKDVQEKEQHLLHKKHIIPQGVYVEEKKEVEPEQWKKTVELATAEIKNKQAKKIVLAREVRLKLAGKAEISAVLQKLLAMQPHSYVFAFEHGEDCFVGATPERLVKVAETELLSTCLAGTAPRGKTAEEDEKIASSLLHDQKNRQEHDFVVQMIKRAIENYCTSIYIPKEPVIYPLKNLQHLYTPVMAKLKNGFGIFDIIEQLHPTPALGGTPTEESLAFIREHELLDRGWYGAPIGWLDSNDNGEFAVAIRSGLIQGDEASLFAGCGVVQDSDPEAEYEETNIKLLPMLSVLGG